MEKKARKRQFSFVKDGPIVEDMYCNDNLSVSTIAKTLGRGYQTIKGYLEYKDLYTGPATKTKQKVQNGGYVPEQHKEGQIYHCTSYGTRAVFRHYFGDACLVWLPGPNFLHYAYCKKTDLTTTNKEN